MLASVVIPTKDKISRLASVLKGLEPQMNDNVEVVIVFDGCNEETVTSYKRMSWNFTPKAVFLSENVGRAKARNYGIREATGDIIIFIDDDRIPDQNFIRFHIEAHSKPNMVVLGRRSDVSLEEEQILTLQHSLTAHQKLKDYAVTEKSYIPFRHPRNIFRWMYCFTGNLSVDRTLLNAIGGFDENFVKWGHEDVDLGIRLYLKGAPFIYRDSIINYHLVHERSYNERNQESLDNLKYLRSKYKKCPLVSLILLILNTKFKYIGTRKFLKEK